MMTMMIMIMMIYPLRLVCDARVLVPPNLYIHRELVITSEAMDTPLARSNWLGTAAHHLSGGRAPDTNDT